VRRVEEAGASAQVEVGAVVGKAVTGAAVLLVGREVVVQSVGRVDVVWVEAGHPVGHCRRCQPVGDRDEVALRILVPRFSSFLES